jgi:predicted dehydrogenase
MMYGLGTHSLDQTLLLFGKPKSVTAFLRVLREGGADGAVDDSFTIILQYGGEQKDLIATVKTTVVSAMTKQLKYFVRGTNGTFLKVSFAPQESQFKPT